MNGKFNENFLIGMRKSKKWEKNSIGFEIEFPLLILGDIKKDFFEFQK